MLELYLDLTPLFEQLSVVAEFLALGPIILLKLGLYHHLKNPFISKFMLYSKYLLLPSNFIFLALFEFYPSFYLQLSFFTLARQILSFTQLLQFSLGWCFPFQVHFKFFLKFRSQDFTLQFLVKLSFLPGPFFLAQR